MVMSECSCWNYFDSLLGIYATSRHIPRVKFAGLIHPGILGCAPSAEVLSVWNKREAELIAANKLDRIVAQPPEPKNVHAGSAAEDIKEKVGKEGARTIPGRPEHGKLSYLHYERNLRADGRVI
jgi:formamidase